MQLPPIILKTMSLQWSAINTKTQKQPYLILFQLLSKGIYFSQNTFLFSNELKFNAELL